VASPGPVRRLHPSDPQVGIQAALSVDRAPPRPSLGTDALAAIRAAIGRRPGCETRGSDGEMPCEHSVSIRRAMASTAIDRAVCIDLFFPRRSKLAPAPKRRDASNERGGKT
jgi:hypothetical protein